MSITNKMVREVGEKLYGESLMSIPKDVKERLIEMRDVETSELARFQLDKILENANIAEQKHAVVCQDTGISSYKIDIGTNVRIEADIEKALGEGTAEATKKIPTIPHSVHPITRQNSGNGVGPHTPILHWGMIPGANYIEITGIPTGGGGDLCSKIKMLTGSTPFSEVKKFIVDVVVEAGCKPCPPMIVGIGLGGMYESVNELAKTAVIRPLNKRNKDPIVEEAENELLEMINSLGIGPMGLGGRTTCLAVNIEYGNTGTYILPVSVKIGCWDVHRKTARLYDDGHIDYLD